jgi:hypothetical protein
MSVSKGKVAESIQQRAWPCGAWCMVHGAEWLNRWKGWMVRGYEGGILIVKKGITRINRGC